MSRARITYHRYVATCKVCANSIMIGRAKGNGFELASDLEQYLREKKGWSNAETLAAYRTSLSFGTSFVLALVCPECTKNWSIE